MAQYTRSEQAILREFGERVRRARRNRGLTQEELAAETGMDRTYIGGIERGERNLSLLNINRLAVTLEDGFAGFFPCPGKRRKS